MTEIFKEGDKVHVTKEQRFHRGINIVVVRPEDVLRVVGYHRGEVCARFEDIAGLPAIHDAFFGRFYLDPNLVEPVVSKEQTEFNRQFEEWQGDSDGTVGVD